MAKDGWIYVAVLTDGLWAPFCAAIERPDLARDPRFASRDDRAKHRAALTDLLAPIFRARTVADWMAALEARGVLCAPVNRYADLEADPQIKASEIIVEEQHPRAGRFRTVDTAVRFARTPGTRRTAARPPWASTPTMFSRKRDSAADDLTRLRAEGVIR